jgi:hypothetical protein
VSRYGYVESPKDLRDYTISKAAKAAELPTEFTLQDLPRVKDQGYVSSCVAHAVSSVLEAHDKTNYSTGWIYGYRPATYYQGEGMVTSQALKTINKVGYVKNDFFNHNVEVPKGKELVDKNIDKLKPEANKKKIKSYARLYGEQEIKTALFQTQAPVLIAILVGSNGLRLKDGVAIVPQQFGGGHQLMCYGWNDKGFLIQNSWGENWGDQGRFILPYDYPIRESWMITMDTDKPDNNDIIVRPSGYLVRKIVMAIYKIIKKLFNL